MSLLEFKIKSLRFLSLPILDGIVPTRLFELRSITLRAVHSPISNGIVPVKFESEMTSF